MNVSDATNAAVLRAADLYLIWLGECRVPPHAAATPPGMCGGQASAARTLLRKLGLIAREGRRAVTVTRAGLKRLDELRNRTTGGRS